MEKHTHPSLAVSVERTRAGLEVVATQPHAEGPLRVVATFNGGPNGVSLRLVRGNLEQLFPTSAIAGHPALSATLRLIADEVDYGRADSHDLLVLLFNSLLIYLDRMHTQLPRPNWGRPIRHQKVERAIELLNQDISKRWSVTLLARAVGLSRAAFARQFQSAVGLSPMRYLSERRMRLAAALLFESDATLAEVAQRVGYRSEFALSRAFKRRYKVSPGAYRRRMAESTPVVQLQPRAPGPERIKAQAIRLAA